ncbi:MAG: VanZ family protein [Chromatiales bacterium]
MPTESWRKLLPLRLQVATLFLLLMWLFFNLYQPWQDIDVDLLLDTGQFDNVTDLSGWQREQGSISWSDETAYVELQPHARLRYSLPAFAGDLLVCSGRIRTEALQNGRYAWDAARIMVYFEDSDGRVHWSHPHNVGYSSGDTDWRQFTVLIEVPGFASQGWVELAHYGKSGKAAFDDIRILPAVWKPAYQHWQKFFGMVWAAIMMWLVLNTHFWTQAWGKAVLACALLIVIGVTLPPATMFQVASSGAKLSLSMLNQAGDVFRTDEPKASAPTQVRNAQPVVSHNDKQVAATQDKQSHRAAAQTGTQLEPVDNGVALNARSMQKIGHSLLFALLGFFSFLAFYGKSPFALVLYSLVLFAFATEVLQLVVDGRLFVLTDLLLDSSGILAGLLVALIWYRIRKTRGLV